MTHTAVLPDHAPDTSVADFDELAPGDRDRLTGPATDADRTFPQSVASGGPTHDGVILWTRIAPDRHDPEEPLLVAVAREDDTDFSEPVLTGRLSGDLLEPVYDHTVRLDLAGELDPDTAYRYRFAYDGARSRVGHCRTLPDPTDSPDSLRLAVVSCQDYVHGYFGAFGHVAEENVDFLVHLGDFIYETTDDRFAGRGSPTPPDRQFELPSGEPVAHSLADFRTCHRTYRSDRSLQRALEAHTLIAGWDDHGVANNRYWDHDHDVPVLPDHPKGDDGDFATQLTADGIRAWYEYTPARVEYHPETEHLHEQFRLYRRVRFGDLAEFALTDERFYRDGPPEGAISPLSITIGVARATDPDRSMLGDEQFDWFTDWLCGRGSTAQWTVWLNAVLSAPMRVGVGPLTAYPKQDAWDGFAHERDEIVRLAEESAENFVTITGDMHTFLALRQGLRHPGPVGSLLDRLRGTEPDPVGVELMTPAVSSVNLAEAIGVEEGLAARLTRPLFSALLRGMNPHWRFVDGHHWGYAVVEFDREGCRWDAYAVDKTTPNPDRHLLQSFRVPTGTTRLEPVE
jgi:alkaline phosphatase D